jgi:hypothetical protein
MPTPQQNLARVESLTAQAQAHPMCLRMAWRGDRLVILYPEGFPLGGVQCSLTNGKAWALERVLEAMERHWLESFPNPHKTTPPGPCLSRPISRGNPPHGAHDPHSGSFEGG